MKIDKHIFDYLKISPLITLNELKALKRTDDQGVEFHFYKGKAIENCLGMNNLLHTIENAADLNFILNLLDINEGDKLLKALLNLDGIGKKASIESAAVRAGKVGMAAKVVGAGNMVAAAAGILVGGTDYMQKQIWPVKSVNRLADLISNENEILLVFKGLSSEKIIHFIGIIRTMSGFSDIAHKLHILNKGRTETTVEEFKNYNDSSQIMPNRKIALSTLPEAIKTNINRCVSYCCQTTELSNHLNFGSGINFLEKALLGFFEEHMSAQKEINSIQNESEENEEKKDLITQFFQIMVGNQLDCFDDNEEENSTLTSGSSLNASMYHSAHEQAPSDLMSKSIICFPTTLEGNIDLAIKRISLFCQSLEKAYLLWVLNKSPGLRVCMTNQKIQESHQEIYQAFINLIRLLNKFNEKLQPADQAACLRNIAATIWEYMPNEVKHSYGAALSLSNTRSERLLLPKPSDSTTHLLTAKKLSDFLLEEIGRIQKNSSGFLHTHTANHPKKQAVIETLREISTLVLQDYPVLPCAYIASIVCEVEWNSVSENLASISHLFFSMINPNTPSFKGSQSSKNLEDFMKKNKISFNNNPQMKQKISNELQSDTHMLCIIEKFKIQIQEQVEVEECPTIVDQNTPTPLV